MARRGRKPGFKLSEEQKLKISLALRGKKRTAETRERIRRSRLGKKRINGHMVDVSNVPPAILEIVMGKINDDDLLKLLQGSSQGCDSKPRGVPKET